MIRTLLKTKVVEAAGVVATEAHWAITRSMVADSVKT